MADDPYAAPMVAWTMDGFRLELFDRPQGDRHDNHYGVDLRLSDQDRVVFDKDYGPLGVPPHLSIDGVNTLVAALFWCTLAPGDVASEFFSDHTPGQLDWLGSPRRDELLLCHDQLQAMVYSLPLAAAADYRPPWACPAWRQLAHADRHDWASCRACWEGFAVGQAGH